MANRPFIALSIYESSSVIALPIPQTSARVLRLKEMPCGRMTCHKTYAAPSLVAISLWRAGPTAGAEEKGLIQGCFPTYLRGGFGKPKVMVFRSKKLSPKRRVI